MKFVLDQHMSHRIVAVLRQARYDVVHLKEKWRPTITDEELMADIRGDACLVTLDGRMFGDPLQMRWVEAAGLGAFLLTSESQGILAMAQTVICGWDRIVHEAKSTPRPFVWIVPPHKSKKKWRLFDDGRLREVLGKRGFKLASVEQLQSESSPE